MSTITGVGLSTADFADRLTDLGAVLDRFEALEVDSVELSLANFEVIAGCRVLRDRLGTLKAVCADRPFAVTVHGPIKSNFADPAHVDLQRDAARACIEVAGELGAGALIHHAALMPHVTAAERTRRLALEREGWPRSRPRPPRRASRWRSRRCSAGSTNGHRRPRNSQRRSAWWTTRTSAPASISAMPF